LLSPAMMPDDKEKKETTMLRKLLGAAAMAAAAFAVVPAYAAHHHAAPVGVGCSGDTFAKAEGQVETMADVPGKFMAEREIAEAQDAMLSGKTGGCAVHLSRALRDESAGQTPDAETMAPAPFAPAVAPPPAEPDQPGQQAHWNWAPLKGGY
jgi:hypothetical protein